MITTRPARTRVRASFNGELIADTSDALVLEEGSYAPVYYLPRKDVKMERLIRTSHTNLLPAQGLRHLLQHLERCRNGQGNQGTSRLLS